MSLPIPLAVRIVTASRDMHLTRHLRDLTFREIAVGGFASATATIDRPVGVQPEEIAYFARIYVYDQTAAVVWEGRLEDQGMEVSQDGQTWRLTAMGPSVHVQDITLPLVYVDRTFGTVVRTSSSVYDLRSGQIQISPETGGDNSTGIWVTVPPGTAVATNERVGASYLGLIQAGQSLAVVDYAWDAGLSTAGWDVEAVVSAGAVRSNAASTSGGSESTRVVGTNWTHPESSISFTIVRSGAGATTSTSDVTWAFFDNVVVRATTYTKSGSLETSGYTSADKTILASTVVADLLGRVLDQYDGASASIDTTSYAITQLAYLDGVTPGKVLEDLIGFEPGYRWGAYESNSAGKYRFEWAAWPTAVRYEASAVDGYSAPLTAGEVYNSVNVYYRDARGQQVSVTSTSSVDDLTDAGITRRARLDIGDSTSAEATQAGEQFLAEHDRPPAQGTLTVARPILDVVDGRWVQPWQIRAGELIRVREVQPRVAALTGAVRDGTSIFKIASREFRASDASAVLELDEYSLSTARALATTQRRRRR
jgi:hypothetical protein